MAEFIRRRKVICIDNKHTERNPYWTDIVDGYPLNQPTLTVGKTYEVTIDYGNKIKVIADHGEERLYGEDKFMELDEWRDKQLNDILDK